MTITELVNRTRRYASTHNVTLADALMDTSRGVAHHIVTAAARILSGGLIPEYIVVCFNGDAASQPLTFIEAAVAPVPIGGSLEYLESMSESQPRGYYLSHFMRSRVRAMP